MSSKDLAILHQTHRMQTQSQEPVTFYDILMLLRELGDEREAGPELLDALSSLTTRAHLTDGARQVLRNFLRSIATLYAQERARAKRGVTSRDHQKRVRLTFNTWFFVCLPQQTGAKTRWEVARPEEGLRVALPAEAGLTGREAARVTFVVRTSRPGNFVLRLTSSSTPGLIRDPSSARKTRPSAAAASAFTLFIAAEPA